MILSTLDKPSYRDLTASRIAALFDRHPFLPRTDLVSQLRGSSGPRRIATPAMRAGRLLEPAIAAAFSEQHPDWQIEKAKDYVRLPTHRLGGILDYRVNGNTVLECKSVSLDEWRKWHGRPPLAYLLQTFCQMVITGSPRGYIAVMVRLFDELPLHVFPVEYSDAAEAILLAAVKHWWEAFDAGQLPPAYPVDALANILMPPPPAPPVLFDGARPVVPLKMSPSGASSYGSHGWGC